MGSGIILKRAQAKYGIENFKKEILLECENEIEMNNKEKEIVNEDFIKRSDTYNLNKGGFGSWSYVNESYTSDRRSEDMKKLYSHEEAKKRVSEAVKKYQEELRKNDPELYEYRKQKAKAALKKFKEEHPTFYEEHKRVGWHHTEEVKERLRSIRLGDKNGMFGKRWVVNYQTRTNKLLGNDEKIPDGFVYGRCDDFDKHEKRESEIKRREQDILDRQNKFNEEMRSFYTNAAKLYNEYGFKKMAELTKYTMTRTNFFAMCKKYSSVELKKINKMEHRKHNKLSSYSLKLRHMSKDERIRFYEEVYEVYKDGGFDAVVKKYDYPNTRNALLGCFKAYVSDYVPTKCNRWG